jgi:RHS repeat-associated protein
VTDRWVYTDRFERPIFLKSQTLSGAYNRVDREYDALGRVYRESAPCWATSCTQYWHTYSYDLLGRPTQLSRPISDSNPTLQNTYTYYEGMTTRVVDAQGKQITQVASAAGQLARSVDHDGYYQSFDYDAFGNAVRVTDSASNTLQSNTYNIHGVLTAQTDMDRGSWTLEPNALGEILHVRDAKTTAPAWTTNLTYDPLGRMTSRHDVAESVTSDWTWGNSAPAKNIGRLASVSGGGYSEIYTYDSIGRLSNTAISSDASYQVDYAYNSLGALHTLTYPTSTSSYRLKLQYDYQYGQVLRVKDFNAPTTVFWQGNATDARGALIDESLGNGIQSIRGFDAVTGLVDYIQSGVGGGTGIQNLAYSWDPAGNLTQRQDLRQSLTEAFVYDNLYRLDYSTLNSVTNLDLSYDALGNVSSKSDVGSYTYHGSKKHAVVSAGGMSFGYDANGNQTSRSGNSVSWYSYNLPDTINGAAGYSSQFFYTPDRARWKQLASYGGTPETTIYVGGLIEKVTLGATTSWKHTIAGPGGPVAVYTRKSDLSNQLHYLTRAHLGSVDSITTGAGVIEVRLSSGAFGQRRAEAGWSGNPTGGDWTQITATTRRGFTFHEHLDNLNLVHLNGRVYDPVVGRFLSADPFVPYPSSTQSFNRYSYVRTNPLTFTDPSGFSDRRFCERSCSSSGRAQSSSSDYLFVTNTRIVSGTGNDRDHSWRSPEWRSRPQSQWEVPLERLGEGMTEDSFEVRYAYLRRNSCIGTPQQCGTNTFWNNTWIGRTIASIVGDPFARLNDGINPISGVGLTPREQFDATGLAAVTALAPWGRVAARGATTAVQEGTTVFRVFGGEARGLGQSWTTVNPGKVANFRESAGLFPGNTGQFVIEGRLMSTEGVLLRDALPGPGGVGGGIAELLIPNAGQKVCIVCVSGVNPPF